MQKKPWASIILVLLTMIVTFMAPVFDTSVYSVNGHPTEWLSFLPESPFRHYGSGIFLSSLLHMNATHLFTNLFFFTPLALMMERKTSGGYLILKFCALHLLVLLGLVLTHILFPLQGKGFIGMSHLVVGLYAYWGITQKKYGFLFFALAMIGIGLWLDQSPLTHLAHSLGLASGLCLVFLSKLWCKVRPKPAH